MPESSEPLRILHLRCSTALYGAEAVIWSYFKALENSPLQMELTLLTREHEHPLLSRIKEPVHIIPASGGFSLQVLGQLKKKVNGGRFRIIHSHDYKSDLYALLLAGPSLASISTTHGWTASDLKVRFYEWLDRRLSKFFDEIISVSPALYDQARALRRHPQHCHLVLNAIDTAAFAARPVPVAADRIMLASVARLSQEKAHALLIDAMASLPEQVHLTIIGDGPLRESLQVQTRRLNLQSRITFLGLRDDIPALLAQMDIFVMPSLREGMPMALLEAMAAGCAPVASAVGAIPEVLDGGHAGVLVPPGDRPALANALAELVGDHLRITRLGAAASERVRCHYDLALLKEQLQKIYIQAAAKR